MTVFFNTNEQNLNEILNKAADVINNGGLVAFPTETVYGLGADGLNPDAVKKIYTAKGRPSDNPLILHISHIKELDRLVKNINNTAKVLMKNFWPGPMTLVFKKSSIVPDIISGGLDTVAIRLPSNEIARQLIAYSKTPIAAPSANTSGRPSPTKASHVFEDLNGKINMILDGGNCEIGVESTVIDVTEDTPVILRPGKISYENIKKLFPDVVYDKHLTETTPVSQPKSPGMKYKHYAPKGELYILDGDEEKFSEYIRNSCNSHTAVITFTDFPVESENVYYLGKFDTPEEGASKIFDILRDCDTNGYDKIFAHMPNKNGVGFALYNRMLKASGGKIIEL